jgi:hypothetical protein
MSTVSPSTAAAASITSQSVPQNIPQVPQSASIALASAYYSDDSPDAHISSWIADTGASAHMTFNRHWMRNLTPHRIAIRLADGSIIYSEGIGSVQLTAVVNGQESGPLEFSNVLYVPNLSSNLLSVLYLTMHCSFITLIEKDILHFIRDCKIQFQAQVTASNSAFLLRETIPVQQLASLSSTPLSLDANPFPISHTRASRPLQLIHSDVHGPLKVSTNQG